MRISDWSSDVCSSDLLIGAYLLGALPFWLMARATRWRMKRKLESTERALVAATAAPSSAPSFPASAADSPRSNERRVGKACVSTCTFLWSRIHQQNNTELYNYSYDIHIYKLYP